jgi:hypothetical protein
MNGTEWTAPKEGATVRELKGWAHRHDSDAATHILGVLAGYPDDARTPLEVRDTAVSPSNYDFLRVSSDTFRCHMK